jgi:4-aminobutyrate aminotransferase/(S)-3-amino-2-methylpropionate transaminase
VQSGYARTGRFFAVEHFGIRPDLITVAKSIAMGIPLSGVLGKAAIMDAPHEGGVGGTYVGNPVAQAAALAVLDVIEEEGLVERSTALGETMRARMASWQERWPRIRDVRGLGSMLAIELDHAATASRVVEEALRRGLLLLKAGVDGRAIRVLVPLVVTDAELDEALAAWEQALEQAL